MSALERDWQKRAHLWAEWMRTLSASAYSLKVIIFLSYLKIGLIVKRTDKWSTCLHDQIPLRSCEMNTTNYKSVHSSPIDLLAVGHFCALRQEPIDISWYKSAASWALITKLSATQVLVPNYRTAAIEPTRWQNLVHKSWCAFFLVGVMSTRCIDFHWMRFSCKLNGICACFVCALFACGFQNGWNLGNSGQVYLVLYFFYCLVLISFI